MTRDEPLGEVMAKNGARFYEYNRADRSPRLRHEDGISRRARPNPWLGQRKPTLRMTFEQFEEVAAIFIDAVIALDVLAAHLQDAGPKSFMDSWSDVIAVRELQAAILTTNAAPRATS